MSNTVVHIIPVFSAKNEPGWLALSKKKKSTIGRCIESEAYYDPDEEFFSWEPAVKSWFIHHDRIEDIIELIELDVDTGNVRFCMECKDGDPCKVWEKIPRLDYLLRSPTQTIAPNRDRIEYAEDVFEWWQARGEEAPPPKPQPPPMWEGFNFNPTPQPPPASRYTNPSSSYQDPLSEFISQFAQFAFHIFNSSTSARQRQHQPPPPPPIAPTRMMPEEAAKAIGVAWPCTKEQLAAAFKKAALQAHPDRGGSTEAMARLNNAREVLQQAIA